MKYIGLAFIWIAGVVISYKFCISIDALQWYWLLLAGQVILLIDAFATKRY